MQGLKRNGPHYYITRPNLSIEKWADRNLYSLLSHGRTRKWRDRFPGERDAIQKKIDPYVKGDIVNIVGKGPSLDYLTKDHITQYATHYATTVGINNAITTLQDLKIKNLVHTRIDQANILSEIQLLPTTVTIRPTATGSISTEHSVIKIERQDVLLLKVSFTALYSVGLFYRCGINNFRMYCFNSAVGDYSYAKCTKTKRSINKDLCYHKKIIEEYFDDCNFEWLLPQKDGELWDIKDLKDVVVTTI